MTTDKELTDKELLKLAAKAAGIELHQWVESCNEFMTTNSDGWNPLTNDGDALRLAVKLGLDVCIDSRQENEPHTHVIGFRDDLSATTIDAIENHGDPDAATRRAIVRAAAEIGKKQSSVDKAVNRMAQRPWVDLTGNEWFDWWRVSPVANETEAEIDFADFLIIAQAVAAKLKEDNK